MEKNRIAVLTPEEQLLKNKGFSLFLKRTFDIVCSFFGLIILSPLLFVTALIVGFSSKGGVFYRQTRVGKNGKHFRIFKFRTMVKDADKKGLAITVGNDSRITKAGRFLRKYKIDELPQLINVLKGDMSFVGPRPEVPEYVELYTQEQRQILLVRPGITDYASIAFRNENELLEEAPDPRKMYIEEIMPRKFELNMQYIRDISLSNDIKLIFNTLGKIAS